MSVAHIMMYGNSASPDGSFPAETNFSRKLCPDSWLNVTLPPRLRQICTAYKFVLVFVMYYYSLSYIYTNRCTLGAKDLQLPLHVSYITS